MTIPKPPKVRELPAGTVECEQCRYQGVFTLLKLKRTKGAPSCSECANRMAFGTSYAIVDIIYLIRDLKIGVIKVMPVEGRRELKSTFKELETLIKKKLARL